MKTAVHIKMDAVDQLLLSEGVCRQLGIISYHGDVKKCRGAKQGATNQVKIVKTVCVLPHQSVMAQVQVPGSCPLLVEENCSLKEASGLLLENTLVMPNEDGLAYVMLSNPTGCSSQVTAGTTVGIVVEVQLVDRDGGKHFVFVYMDDVLVFSDNLKDHLQHLQLGIRRIQDAGLKGRVLTPNGLKTNPKLVESVTNYPIPQNIKEVKQFLGLSSYYRRFIKNFANIAQPLHALTRSGVDFHWTEHCQEAFDSLKQHLTTAPVLSYPSVVRLHLKLTLARKGLVLSSPRHRRMTV